MNVNLELVVKAARKLTFAACRSSPIDLLITFDVCQNLYHLFICAGSKPDLVVFLLSVGLQLSRFSLPQFFPGELQGAGAKDNDRMGYRHFGLRS